MHIEDVKRDLETIYIDYYDGLYNEFQLKQILLELYKKTNLSNAHWSEMILDAQWKYASEFDYEEKIKQLTDENSAEIE